MRQINRIKPYCYILTRLSDQKKYFGVRWANVKNKKTPKEDFGKIYFSSHKILKKQFRKNPTKFKFSITVTFNSIKQARDYEVKRNKKIINDKGWLNIQAWPAIMNKQAPNLGIPMSKETKIKISSAKKGKKLNIPLETRKRLSEMRKGHTWNKGRKRSKKFKETYGIKFPTLLINDPISRFFNYKSGDIIKIIRCKKIKEDSNYYITYRIVK